MIGDNPLSGKYGTSLSAAFAPPLTSDIDGANRYGWNSVLLRTGVYAGGEPAKKPTMITDDVELAVEWAWKKELKKMQA